MLKIPRAFSLPLIEEIDFAAFVRPHLFEVPRRERFRRGAPFNSPDRKTFYGGADAGYTDYPSLGT